MSDGGAADGPHECPFDEDYHAWVHGSTAYVRGYRVDATCGECESGLNARYEEHMVVLECSECTVGQIDEVDEWRTRPEPVTWYVSVPNTADLTTWSFYLTGENAAVEAVPHGVSVSDSFTEDSDEYELHVALPEKGTERDLATDGGVDWSAREIDREAVRGTAGDYTHGMLLGKRWVDRAEDNIEAWGHQRHDTTLLALIEEIGEIAIAFESHNAPGGGPHPVVEPDAPHFEGRRLIAEMAELGRRTREYLESNYEEPAGDGGDGPELELHGDPKDASRLFEEIDDAGPLLYQLYWAVERHSGQGGESA